MNQHSELHIKQPATYPQRDADDPQAFNHCFAEVNGIRMHYVDEGEGPLVILLHGFPYLWYMWRRQILALAAAGYRVVVPDQRGFGQTERPDAIEAYDARRMKSFLGKTFLGIVRSTFLIDREGRIAKIWDKVKVKGHADEVLDAVKKL